MTGPAAAEVAALSAQVWAWMSAQDAEQLATVLHDEAVFVHMGATLPREHELDTIATGRIWYRDVEVSDVDVKVLGPVAIVLTTMRLGAVVGGDEVSNPFVVTEVYVEQDGRRLLASMSFTRLLTA